jgi:hypothetical protein
MAARIEWRTKGKGKDALLYVSEFGEDSNTVLRAWEADPDLLADFLNGMEDLNGEVTQLETDVDERNPDGWGALVMTRAHHGGDILSINPELYWDGIYTWFRAHGRDPHPWTKQSKR